MHSQDSRLTEQRGCRNDGARNLISASDRRMKRCILSEFWDDRLGKVSGEVDGWSSNTRVRDAGSLVARAQERAGSLLHSLDSPLASFTRPSNACMRNANAMTNIAQVTARRSASFPRNRKCSGHTTTPKTHVRRIGEPTNADKAMHGTVPSSPGSILPGKRYSYFQSPCRGRVTCSCEARACYRYDEICRDGGRHRHPAKEGKDEQFPGLSWVRQVLRCMQSSNDDARGRGHIHTITYRNWIDVLQPIKKVSC